MKERKLARLKCSSRPRERAKKEEKKGKQKALVSKYNKQPPCITAVTKC